jgi:PAS domain S-box-containing protein
LGLAELLSDWYWEQDEELRLTYVSGRLREKTGIDPDLLIGRKRWEKPALNLTPADWERHRAQLERREPFRDFELQRIADDGRAVWLSVSGEPVFDDDGRFKGYRGVGRDVTAQKRTEELLALEHAVARCLSHAGTVSEGLQAALRAMCEIEGWDYGRYFRLDAATGALHFEDAWFAREPAIEQLLEKSRMVWQSGKAVWSTDLPRVPGAPRRPPAGASAIFATFAFAAVADGRTVGMLAFSGHCARAGSKAARDRARDRQPVRPVPAAQGSRGLAARERSALPQPDPPVVRFLLGNGPAAPLYQHRARAELRCGAHRARRRRQDALGHRVGQP